MMSKTMRTLQTVGIILVALLLAMLLGMLVTVANADGPVIWKQLCPAHHEIRLVPDKAGGQHVLCVRMAEEVSK